MVRWWRDHEHPVRTFFSSKSGAEEKAAELRRGFKEGISPDKVKRFEAFELEAKAKKIDRPVEEIFRLGVAALERRKATDGKDGKTIAELHDDFLKSRRAAGCRPITITGYKRTLSILALGLPGPLAGITPERISAYLSGRPLSRATRVNYARHLKVFFGWAGISPNPVGGLRFPREDAKPIEFFTRDEALIILREARPADRGQLALVLFAGIRPESSGGFCPDDIRDHAISIRPELSKDRQPHTLERTNEHAKGLYPNLWAWLKAFPYEPQSWHRLRDRIKARLESAKMRWKRDGTRHAFATHYYALHGLEDTARLLTHSGLALVKRHYAGIVSSKDAAAYFAIMPRHLGPSANRSNSIRTRKIAWPSDDQIRSRLARTPMTRLAAEWGVSDVALAKHCRLRSIPTPPRGHWTKVSWKSADE